MALPALPVAPPFRLRARVLTPLAAGGTRYLPDGAVQVDSDGRISRVSDWAEAPEFQVLAPGASDPGAGGPEVEPTARVPDFDVRPWLVLPARTLIFPDGRFETGRGVFYSEILRIEGDSARTTMLLPPRYLGHEEEVARIYNFAGTRNVGLRAAWAWFKAMFTGKTATA